MVAEIQSHQVKTFRNAKWHFIKSVNIYWKLLHELDPILMNITDNIAWQV